MDIRPEPEASFQTTTDNPRSQYPSAFFPNATRFTVSGGTFTSVTNHYNDSVPSDFKVIPLGDICLQHEIHWDPNLSAAYRSNRPTRRVYSAKISSESRMSVALYRGEHAKEEWQKDLSKLSSLRHPNVVQLFGITQASEINALIFHDELIPFRAVLARNCLDPSAFLSIYFDCATDFQAVKDDLNIAADNLSWGFWAFSIRHSTGRLCLDFSPGMDSLHVASTLEDSSRGRPSARAIQDYDINSLSLDVYHYICFWFLSKPWSIILQTPTIIDVCSVVERCPGSDFASWRTIVTWVQCPQVWGGWEHPGNDEHIRDDGWIRCSSENAETILLHIEAPMRRTTFGWLTQANCAFSCVQNRTDLHNYVLITSVSFKLSIQHELPRDMQQQAYLFRCPVQDFYDGWGISSVRIPDCAAYWSLDEDGRSCLTSEEATRLGLPAIELETSVWGCCWDAPVYEGLSRFHASKGFDPNSQDVARHLSYPLCGLSEQAIPDIEKWYNTTVDGDGESEGAGSAELGGYNECLPQLEEEEDLAWPDYEFENKFNDTDEENYSEEQNLERNSHYEFKNEATDTGSDDEEDCYWSLEAEEQKKATDHRCDYDGEDYYRSPKAKEQNFEYDTQQSEGNILACPQTQVSSAAPSSALFPWIVLALAIFFAVLSTF